MVTVLSFHQIINPREKVLNRLKSNNPVLSTFTSPKKIDKTIKNEKRKLRKEAIY